MPNTQTLRLPRPVEPAFEISPIRLSVEETKIILRISVAAKPIHGDYQCAVLADFGILRRIEVSEEKDTSRKIAECWQRARKALGQKDSAEVHQAMHDIDRLSSDRDRNDRKYLYDLTDLGKQIARGITIRLNSQVKQYQ
jgi:hypothetical protein